MKIIQLSDLHLRADGRLSFLKMDTMASTICAINHFESLKEQPDCYVITGDLGDHGNLASYAVLKEMFHRLPVPVYIVPGNHDNREAFAATFGEFCPVKSDIAPYVCYTVESPTLRLVMVETIDQGKHWGCLQKPVADWLEKTLLEKLDVPTVVFTHHPPFKSGLAAMDEPFGNVEEFARILKLHPNLTLCCGHLHRATFTNWQGIPTMVCPPIAMMMELDFTAAGGDAFYLADPGYLVHRFEDGSLTSFVEVIPSGASYSGPHPFTYLEGEHSST